MTKQEEQSVIGLMERSNELHYAVAKILPYIQHKRYCECFNEGGECTCHLKPLYDHLVKLLYQ